MARDRELPRRPDWWPEWVPEACPDGHPWRPGTVSVHPVSCRCRNDETVWHNVYNCNHCRHEVWPPDHVGPHPDAGRMATL